MTKTSFNTVHNTIIQAFIDVNVYFEPNLFKPFFMSDHVLISDDCDKESFFDFFENMLCCAKERAVGELFRIINTSDFIHYRYEFYDQTHRHSFINYEIQFLGDKIFFEIYPF